MPSEVSRRCITEEERKHHSFYDDKMRVGVVLCAFVSINGQYNIHIISILKIFPFFGMNIMNLRHKKPINSYKGQANNDKNQFNDDDFGQQISPLKKNPQLNADQISKYAKILSKFMKNINVDLRNKINSTATGDSKSGPPEKEPRRLDDPLDTAGRASRRQEGKQHKQITKFQSKLSSKERQSKDSLPPPTRRRTNPIQSTQPNPRPSSSQSIPVMSQRPTLNPSQINSASSINAASSPIRAQYPPAMNPAQSPLTNLGLPLPAPFTGLMQQPDGMFNFGMTLNLMTQMEMTQLYMRNFMSQVNATNTGRQMQRMYNNGPIPGNTINLNGLNAMNALNFTDVNGLGVNAGMPINQQANIYPQNLAGYQQNGIRSINRQMKPLQIQNLFNKQIEQTQRHPTSRTDQKKQQISSVFPLKRSAYHVSIAYKIYIDQLKDQGKDLSKLEQIDPARVSREMKKNAINGGMKSKIKKK